MKILFTGSRWWKDEKSVRNFLNALDRETVIIEGAYRGLDDMVYKVAGELGFTHRVRFPARWNKYRESAGPRRNTLMLETSKPDLVVAFPLQNSHGTLDMMLKAARAKVPTFVIVAESHR